jgi:hypothetical protein
MGVGLTARVRFSQYRLFAERRMACHEVLLPHLYRRNAIAPSTRPGRSTRAE